MYILYANNDMSEFGIWKISPDMLTQTCVYYSDDSLDGWDTVHPLDDILDNSFVNESQVSILTKEQAAELVFLNN